MASKKKVWKSLMVVGLCIWMAAACTQELQPGTMPSQAEEQQNPETSDGKTRLTLYAGAPGEDINAKTVLTEGTVPKWLSDDAIGVISDYGAGLELARFDNDSNVSSRSTTFSGSLEHPDGDLYPVYPYYDAEPSADYAYVPIKRGQTVSAGSYDGSCDVMVGKKVELDGEGVQVEGLHFKRLGAIVKVLLKNYPSEYATAFSTEKVHSLTLESDTRSLSGTVRVDWKNGTKDGLASTGYYSDVRANYPVSEMTAMGSSHATYFVVYPGTLASGSTLTVTAVTTNYVIKKVITLSSDIVLEEGNGTLLNVSLDRGNVSITEKKMYLYFWAMDTDPTQAVEMTRVSSGVYEWEGWCFASQFKFNTDNSSDKSYWTGYFRDESASEANYWTATTSFPSSDDGGVFELSHKSLPAGVYRITLNTNTNAVTCTTLPMYMYITNGDDTPIRQTMTNNGDGTYSWTGYTYRYKDFRFVTSATEKENGYMRKTGGSDYFSLTQYDADSTHFCLMTNNMSEGIYCVTVNPQPSGFASSSATAMTVQCEFVVEDLYLDCWNWGNVFQAQAMTNLGNGKYTWTGIMLNNYKFKFVTRKDYADDYWSGFFRDPDAGDYLTIAPTAKETMFSVSDLGTGFRGMLYTVNVNVNTHKVEVIPHVWLAGPSFDCGWDRTKAKEMTYLGNGILQWYGYMYVGAAVGENSFKFLIASEVADSGEPLAPRYPEYSGYYMRWYGFVRNPGAADYWTAYVNDADDTQFDILQLGYTNGYYTVRLDLKNMHVSIIPGSTSGTGVSITPIIEDPE